MNKAEFNKWKKHTDSSQGEWLLDPIHNGKNGQEYVFHRGGVDGQYISIDLGVVTIGDYNGAIPHIGEASFRPLYSSEYGSDNEACLALIYKGGFDFIKDLVTVDESEYIK